MSKTKQIPWLGIGPNSNVWIMPYDDDDVLELDTERALEALRWCWETVYEVFIEDVTGLWCARRLDGLGTIEGNGPDRLRIEILDDWALRPASS